MAVRSLKALFASLAVVIALFVAAVPANAKSGSGNGNGHKAPVSMGSYEDWCAPNCVVFFLS